MIVNFSSYDDIKPVNKTRSGKDLLTISGIWIVIDAEGRDAEAVLSGLTSKMLAISSNSIQSICAQTAKVQSKDVERAPKPFLMVHVKAFSSPLGINTIAQPIKDLNLCAVYGYLKLKHYAGMRFLHGEFEEKVKGGKRPRTDPEELRQSNPAQLTLTQARQLAQDQKERVVELEEQIRYLNSFTDTCVAPEQQQQFQTLIDGEAKHQRMIAEYFYSLYLKYENMKEAIFMDKMVAVKRNARVWEQQYKALLAQMLLKEAGFEGLRQRDPDLTEKWLCHQVQQTVWKKHKEMEASYRESPSFMAQCSAEADRWLKNSLQGELGEQFLTKWDPYYITIKREYHTSRPYFKAPDDVVQYVQQYDDETGFWEGPTEEDVLDEYIDTLEEAAVVERQQALNIALNGALKTIGVPLMKAERRANKVKAAAKASVSAIASSAGAVTVKKTVATDVKKTVVPEEASTEAVIAPPSSTLSIVDTPEAAMALVNAGLPTKLETALTDAVDSGAAVHIAQASVTEGRVIETNKLPSGGAAAAALTDTSEATLSVRDVACMATDDSEEVQIAANGVGVNEPAQVAMALTVNVVAATTKTACTASIAFTEPVALTQADAASAAAVESAVPMADARSSPPVSASEEVKQVDTAAERADLPCTSLTCTPANASVVPPLTKPATQAAASAAYSFDATSRDFSTSQTATQRTQTALTDFDARLAFARVTPEELKETQQQFAQLVKQKLKEGISYKYATGLLEVSKCSWFGAIAACCSYVGISVWPDADDQDTVQQEVARYAKMSLQELKETDCIVKCIAQQSAAGLAALKEIKGKRPAEQYEMRKRRRIDHGC
jgi:hypothetical protein